MQKYHAFFCAGKKRLNMNQYEPSKIVEKGVNLQMKEKKKTNYLVFEKPSKNTNRERQ